MFWVHFKRYRTSQLRQIEPCLIVQFFAAEWSNHTKSDGGFSCKGGQAQILLEGTCSLISILECAGWSTK